jgi:hypothetical protein
VSRIDMDLVLIVLIVGLSFSLALAGARVVLWSLFCLMTMTLWVSGIRLSHAHQNHTETNGTY